MTEIKRGDRVTMTGRDGYEFKVMAVADGWAMCRFPRAIPFAAPLKELTRVSVGAVEGATP